jgi:hypothetical protein
MIVYIRTRVSTMLNLPDRSALSNAGPSSAIKGMYVGTMAKQKLDNLEISSF